MEVVFLAGLQQVCMAREHHTHKYNSVSSRPSNHRSDSWFKLLAGFRNARVLNPVVYLIGGNGHNDEVAVFSIHSVWKRLNGKNRQMHQAWT